MRPLTIRKLMTLVMQVALLLAAIMVILPLFLPAMTTRHHGHGRRGQCMSNLRQMGLGILGYTNQFGRFPPGTIPNANLPEGRHLGWGSTILPYIDLVDYFSEQGTTFKAASALAWDDPVFADLATNPPGIAKCPESLTRAGYVAIAGLGPDSPRLWKYDRRAGIFGDDRTVTVADIKDGTANTMMLAESDTIPAPWFAGGRATVRGLDPFRRPYLGPGRQFGGHHKGGANVQFADGSVRFLADSIDPKVFEAISTMAGGEALSDPGDSP